VRGARKADAPGKSGTLSGGKGSRKAPSFRRGRCIDIGRRTV
jgi:hypothetical protein